MSSDLTAPKDAVRVGTQSTHGEDLVVYPNWWHLLMTQLMVISLISFL